MSDYRIDFDPKLAINPEVFAIQWNKDSKASIVTQVKIRENITRTAEWMPTVIAVLSGVALGVAINAIYDLIKQALKPLVKQETHKLIDVQEVIKEDGTKVLVVIVSPECYCIFIVTGKNKD